MTQQVLGGTFTLDAIRVLGLEPLALCRAPLDIAQCPEAVRRGHADWVCLELIGHEGPHVASRIPYDPLRVYTWYTHTNPPDFSTLQAELAWLEGGTV